MRPESLVRRQSVPTHDLDFKAKEKTPARAKAKARKSIGLENKFSPSQACSQTLSKIRRRILYDKGKEDFSTPPGESQSFLLGVFIFQT